MFINAALFRDLTTILPTRGTQLAVLNNKVQMPKINARCKVKPCLPHTPVCSTQDYCTELPAYFIPRFEHSPLSMELIPPPPQK